MFIIKKIKYAHLIRACSLQDKKGNCRSTRDAGERYQFTDVGFQSGNVIDSSFVSFFIWANIAKEILPELISGQERIIESFIMITGKADM